jgi:CheY-like chemotaxis protein
MHCVLVVENDQDTRDSICEVLVLDGHLPQVAGDGEEAVRILTESDLPRVILLDCSMPRMTGPEFLDWLGEHPRFAGLPVIVTSGDSEAASHPRAQYALIKPFDADELLTLVRTFCPHSAVSERSPSPAL